MRILVLLLSTAAQFSFAAYNEKTHQFKCGKVSEVAKEAVAYSLLGAWEPYAKHKCFADEKFEYFLPRAAKPEGDVISTANFFQFKKGKDKYGIESVKKAGDEYEIAVNFTIDGKKLSTKYIYTPDPEYTGRTGICGFINNETHKILRSDCIDQKLRADMIKNIK